MCTNNKLIIKMIIIIIIIIILNSKYSNHSMCTCHLMALRLSLSHLMPCDFVFQF